MTMYGLYNNEGKLIRWKDDFSHSSITFSLLAEGYVQLTGEDLEKVKSARNNLISKLQEDIGIVSEST